MALPFFNWSRTASSNATADSTVNWAEGQLPSTVNDSARAMMASTAAYRDDVACAITTGGSATAYTVTSFQVFDTLAHLNGQMIGFVPHATNTNAVGVDVTLNVDSLGAKSVRMAPGVALPNGTLILGTPYIVTYNNSDSVFYIQNMSNPYSIPLAGGLDFWGTTAPNSSFAFPLGQTLSRTTYATLFSIMGTTYGAGDGSTTFALPDKGERVSVMKVASGSRLTTAGSGIDGGTMGATGGAQKRTLAANQIPSLTSVNASQSITSTAPGSIAFSSGGWSGQSLGAGAIGGASTSGSVGSSLGWSTNNSISVAYTNGSQSDVITAQPTIVCNYIIRVV